MAQSSFSGFIQPKKDGNGKIKTEQDVYTLKSNAYLAEVSSYDFTPPVYTKATTSDGEFVYALTTSSLKKYKIDGTLIAQSAVSPIPSSSQSIFFHKKTNLLFYFPNQTMGGSSSTYYIRNKDTLALDYGYLLSGSNLPNFVMNHTFTPSIFIIDDFFYFCGIELNNFWVDKYYVTPITGQLVLISSKSYNTNYSPGSSNYMGIDYSKKLNSFCYYQRTNSVSRTIFLYSLESDSFKTLDLDSNIFPAGFYTTGGSFQFYCDSIGNFIIVATNGANQYNQLVYYLDTNGKLIFTKSLIGNANGNGNSFRFFFTKYGFYFRKYDGSTYTFEFIENNSGVKLSERSFNNFSKQVYDYSLRYYQRETDFIFIQDASSYQPTSYIEKIKIY